jgi:hypothetical protein
VADRGRRGGGGIRAGGVRPHVPALPGLNVLTRTDRPGPVRHPQSQPLMDVLHTIKNALWRENAGLAPIK